jgi:hypothetical protein
MQREIDGHLAAGGYLWLLGDVIIANRENTDVALRVRLRCTPTRKTWTPLEVEPLRECPPAEKQTNQKVVAVGGIARAAHLSEPIEIASKRTARGHLEFLADPTMVKHRGLNDIAVHANTELEFTDLLTGRTLVHPLTARC